MEKDAITHEDDGSEAVFFVARRVYYEPVVAMSVHCRQNC